MEALGGFGEQRGYGRGVDPERRRRAESGCSGARRRQAPFHDRNDRIFVYSQQGLQSFRFDGTDRRTHLKVVGKNLTEPAETARRATMSA